MTAAPHNESVALQRLWTAQPESGGDDQAADPCRSRGRNRVAFGFGVTRFSVGDRVIAIFEQRR